MPHVIWPETGEAEDALVPVWGPVVCVCATGRKKWIDWPPLITGIRVHTSIGLGELAAPSAPTPPLPPSPPPWSTSMRSAVHLYVRGGGSAERFQILALCSRRRRRIDALNASRPASSHHCTPAYWHVLIILQYGLPLKVIPPEHNHAQSKAQTSYIKKTVNSPGVHSTPQHQGFLLYFGGWSWNKSNGTRVGLLV